MAATWLRRAVYLIPAANLFWIVLFLSDYSNVWVEPEVNGWRGYLAGMQAGPWEIIRSSMNWVAFETAPRLTRPLSSLLESIDFLVRAALWRFVPPHPTFSVTWLFTLLIVPLLLYWVLRSLGVRLSLALCGVALYLASPGVLSMVSMGFRPGKAMVTASLAVMLWWASRLRAASLRTVAPLYAFLLLSLYWDETALILYPALAFLFPRVVFSSRSSIAAFLSIPLVYGYSLRWMLPAIYAAAGFPLPSGASYFPQRRFNALVRLPPRIEAYYLLTSEFFRKARIVLMDSLGLIDPTLPDSGPYYLLFAAIVVCLAVLGILITRNILRRPWKTTEDRRSLSLVIRSAGLVVVSVLFHVMLLNSVNQGSWGLYWYGAFLVIPFVIAVVVLLEHLRVHSLFAAGFVILVSAASFYVFPFTNNAYRRFHYYPQSAASLLRDVFDNKINRFRLPGPMANGAEMLRYTRDLSGHGAGGTVFGAPVELLYVAYERGEFGLAENGEPCRFQHGTFNFVRSPSGSGIDCHELAVSAESVMDFLGTWRGDSSVSIAPNHGFVVIDHDGIPYSATIDGARIEIPVTKSVGRLANGGRSVVWNDGVVWQRVGAALSETAHSETMEGRWLFNGVQTIRRARTGDVLIIRSGRVAGAGLVLRAALLAPGNGGTGLLSTDGKTILWTDRSPWHRED